MAAGTTSQPVQQIGFCQAPDGVRIAYAVHGHGPALLISTCWLSHLQFDWQSPVWRHFLTDLGQFATVIRFDERGHGLSDWDVTDHGLEARVGDLEAVAEAAGHPTFALMGMAQGGPVAVAYAVRHPERVTRMLFYGSFSNATRLMTEEDRHVEGAFEPLIRAGWARPDSTFRRVFTSLMIPGATEQQMTWIDDLQRVATSASTAAIARQQRREADVDALLAHVRAPTLVLHSTGDQMNKFELGRALASGIAGARLVALPSNNHIVLADEPAWAIFVDEVRRFLEPDVRPSAPEPVRELLSDRELEVLHLVAQGQDNSRVADALHVSVRTVERHLQNIYAKLGLQGHSARVAAAARLLA
jgi:pimeloyl-ACP methyl ester carboxylesterase/DNA-binding CsgD family transcriptional regulator